MSVKTELKKKGWDDDNLKKFIEKASDGSIGHALVTLFYNQNANERRIQRSRQNNGKGFNKQDAGLGSYFATKVLAGKRLTTDGMKKAREMVPKYHRQVGPAVRKSEGN